MLFGGSNKLDFKHPKKCIETMVSRYDFLQSQIEDEYTVKVPKMLYNASQTIFKTRDRKGFVRQMERTLMKAGVSARSRKQKLESSLKPFCFMNKRFFPQLWTCPFMKQ